jgi:exodeoxyribonuclease VII large subunit
LAELAADLRASTPSNAAELLVPDKTQLTESFNSLKLTLKHLMINKLELLKRSISLSQQDIEDKTYKLIDRQRHNLEIKRTIINAFNPSELLKIGYAVVRDSGGNIIRSVRNIKIDEIVKIKLHKGKFEAVVNKINELD